jgi:cell wall-associated NlpC family hydrolase
VGVSGLLEAPGLQASAQARAFLASGGVDPRVVSVLDSVLAHHQVGVADVVSASSPVHVQALDIVSVDGQPVGPDNFAARDLVTEIAALDPSVRPDEIGTPWPIQSPGFFSDQSSQASLHLAFEMPGANAGVQAAGVVPGANAVPAPVPGAVPGAVGSVPGAAVPGAVGATPGAVPGAIPAGVDPTAAAQPGAPAANAISSATPAGAGTVVDAAAGAGAGAGSPNFASPIAHAAFEAAHKELGVPYLYGGESPKAGFDCSGLMQWAYHQVGVDLPRVADQQFTAGTSVGLNDLKEGDLVFFRIGGGDVDHVGMYVGNHMFLEAPRTGEVVQMADLRNSYWSSQFAGARRVVPLSGAGLATSAGSGGATAPVAPITPAAPATPVGPATPAVPATPVGPATPAAPATPPVPATPVAGTTPVVDPTTGAPPTPAPADPTTAAPPAGAQVPAAGAPVTVAGATPPAADPNAAGASIPGTAQFQAVGGHEHHYKLNTVKFLRAVQPPATPAPAGGTGAPAGVDPTAAQPGQPVAGQPVVDPVTGQPGTAAPAGTGVPSGTAGDALSQAAPAGSVVSVSSSLLTSGQQTFVAHLSSLTGLNTRVVAGWVLAEESGSAAQGREAASNFNWLNIGYFDSGTGAIAHASPFGNPVSAAEQTAKFLKGQWGGASSGIQDILHTVGKPPEDQIMAIANSGWASSHYNNGANLRATFEELANMKVVTAAPAGAGLAVPPTGTAIT